MWLLIHMHTYIQLTSASTHPETRGKEKEKKKKRKEKKRKEIRIVRNHPIDGFARRRKTQPEWTGGCAISNLRWRQSDPVIHCPHSHLNFAPSANLRSGFKKQTFFGFFFSAIRIPRNCDNSVTGGALVGGDGNVRIMSLNGLL